MSNVSSIRSRKASARDPGRERLREVIDAQRQAAAAVEQQGVAIRNMIAERNAAKKAAEAAKAEIDIALTAHADAIARAAAAGSAAPTTSGVRVMRDRQQDMLDQADALAAALEKLRGDLPELRRAEVLAARDVEACVCELFADPAEKLLAEALALRARLDPLVSALASLFVSDIGQHDGEFGRMDVRGDALDQINKAMMPLFAKLDTPGEPWRTMRAALIENPDADLEPHLKRNADGAGTSGNAS